jgi:hypothetical protein
MSQCYNNSNTLTQGVSLCIPRLSGETDKNIIAKRFSELGIGNVYKVDMIWKTSDKGEKFYSAFVHIDWNSNDLSKYIIDRVTSGKDIKIIYDGFLFWKVFLNKSVSKNSGSKNSGSKNYRSYNNEKSHIDSSSKWERNAKIQ